MPPARVARLLDALGHLQLSESRGALADSGRLTAPRAQLREVLLVAIDDAADALSGDCTRLLRGTGSVARARAGVEELNGLLVLLESVDRPPPSAQPSSR